jgi:hypothetical protein
VRVLTAVSLSAVYAKYALAVAAVALVLVSHGWPDVEIAEMEIGSKVSHS